MEYNACPTRSASASWPEVEADRRGPCFPSIAFHTNYTDIYMITFNN